VLLVSAGNSPLQVALETPLAKRLCQVEQLDPSALDQSATIERLAAGTDRLVIFDRCQPREPPNCHAWYIDSVPPAEWQRGDIGGPLSVVDLDRTHPLLRYTDLVSLRIAEGTSITGPAGSTTLITGDSGPLLVLHSREGWQDLVLGLTIIDQDGQLNTDWPLRPSWPVFVLNVLQHLAGAAAAGTSPQLAPGQTFAVRSDLRDRLILRDPDGAERPIERQPGIGSVITDTERLGTYEALDGEQVVERFDVNLFDRQESTIPPAESIELGYEPVAGTVAQEIVRTDLWRWVLLAALGLLAAEWIYFSNRLRM
jgi:hypothetical protein